MSIIYGHNVIQKDDPFVESMEETLQIVILMTPERAILFNCLPQRASYSRSGSTSYLTDSSSQLSTPVVVSLC